MTDATGNEPRDEPLGDKPLGNEPARDELDYLAADQVDSIDLDGLQHADERVLRAQAELENYRKRARREIEEERRYAHLPLVADLLPVLDNLNRAIGAAEQNEGAAGLLDGVKMVATQLLGVIETNQCQRIADMGEPFDPNLHEAIGQEPSSEYESGIICRVTRSGYRLHERVVRPSQVMISTGQPEASSVDD